MPATDLVLLLCVVGLSPADATRVAGMELGYVLGYLSGRRQDLVEVGKWLWTQEERRERERRLLLFEQAIGIVWREQEAEKVEQR